jgi:hypothetical protein
VIVELRAVNAEQTLGRRPGKQPGAPGAHPAQVERPDEVVEHVPERCGGCGADLAGAAVVGAEARQVADVLATAQSMRTLASLRVGGRVRSTTAPNRTTCTARPGRWPGAPGRTSSSSSTDRLAASPPASCAARHSSSNHWRLNSYMAGSRPNHPAASH